MKVIIPGHRYVLDHLDGDKTTSLQFVQRQPFHEPTEGVTNQEVLRCIINRVQTLNSEVPWENNQKIIYHLRMALALHEARAVERHIEKGEDVENYPVGPDGHWIRR